MNKMDYLDGLTRREAARLLLYGGTYAALNPLEAVAQYRDNAVSHADPHYLK